MKRFLFVIITILTLVFLTGCVFQTAEKAAPSSPQEVEEVEQPAPQKAPVIQKQPTVPKQTTPQPEETEEEQAPIRVVKKEETPPPQALYGALPIGLAESTKAIDITDYQFDRTQDTAALTLVKLTIRNTGREPIRPRVIMQLTGEGFNVNKVWDYDLLVNGYKFEKEAKLNIKLDQPKVMKIMKLSVLDMGNNMKEIGSDTKQFIPIPPKKQS